MNRFRFHKARAAALVAVAALAIVLASGCGPSTENADFMPQADSARTNPPASGVAITEDLSIDQIAFESPVRSVIDKNGLKFLTFSYADKDGKVYSCRLPSAMAVGKRKPDQWLAVFAVYRQQTQAVARRSVTARPAQNLGDFPFISPKPQEAQPSGSAPSAAPAPKPSSMPSLPALPSSSAPLSRPDPEGASGPGPGPMPPVAP